MREILFRGKDIKGNWHIGLLAHIGNAWYISNSAGVSTAFEVIPETIGQFTGLTDDKDKKIFEGDIVECYSSDYIGYPKIDTITVKNMTDYNTMVYLNCSNRLVVIGNIHDNSELLK